MRFPAAIRGISHPIPPGIIPISGPINHFAKLCNRRIGLHHSAEAPSLGGATSAAFQQRAPSTNGWFVCSFQAIYGQREKRDRLWEDKFGPVRSIAMFDRCDAAPLTWGSPPTCEKKKCPDASAKTSQHEGKQLPPEGVNCSFLFLCC